MNLDFVFHREGLENIGPTSLKKRRELHGDRKCSGRSPKSDKEVEVGEERTTKSEVIVT